MAADQTIADWTTTDLIKFIQAVLRDDETVRSTQTQSDNYTVNTRLTVANEIAFSQPSATTVGAAGGASALPATPKGYVKFVGPDGTVYQFPFYLTA